MKFEMDIDERKRFIKWNRKHLAEKHGGKEPEAGAIGGRISFVITGTSLGQILSVKCACGDTEGLTDFSDW